MPLRRNRARKEVQPKEEPFSFAQVPEYSKPRPVAKHAKYRSCCCGLVVVHRVWASRMACEPGSGVWSVGRWAQAWWSGGQTESRKELGN